MYYYITKNQLGFIWAINPKKIWKTTKIKSDELKKIDVFVKKETPKIKLVLEDNFINLYWWEEIAFTKTEFIKHVYELYTGKTLPSNNIKR